MQASQSFSQPDFRLQEFGFYTTHQLNLYKFQPFGIGLSCFYTPIPDQILASNTEGWLCLNYLVLCIIITVVNGSLEKALHFA